MNLAPTTSLVLALVVASASAARADRAPAELPYNLWADIPVTLGAVGVWAGTEAARSSLAPTECRWCEAGRFDTGVRERLLWESPSVADWWSNVTVAAVVPATVGVMVLAEGVDGAWLQVPVDLLLVAEATALAGAVNQVVKLSVGRERPFVDALSEEEKDDVDNVHDNNLSFYSGHTSLAFALLTSTATVATMRGYRLAPWIWTFGLPLAVGTGYLRVAGDKHWATDVLTGAAAGAAIGFAVPFFFHRPWEQRAPSLTAAPVDGGGLVLATWRL